MQIARWPILTQPCCVARLFPLQNQGFRLARLNSLGYTAARFKKHCSSFNLNFTSFTMPLMKLYWQARVSVPSGKTTRLNKRSNKEHSSLHFALAPAHRKSHLISTIIRQLFIRGTKSGSPGSSAVLNIQMISCRPIQFKKETTHGSSS